MKIMVVSRFIVLFIVVLVSLACNVYAKGDLREDLMSGAIWQMGVEDFGKKYLEGERGGWVDQEKTTIRLPQPKITIGELVLGEMLVKWRNEKPVSLQIMIYNKGDNGAVDKEKFDEQLEQSLKKLNEIFGEEGKPFVPKSKESAVRNLKGWQWKSPALSAILDSNTTGTRKNFEAEFIRLRIMSPGGVSQEERASKKDLKSNVKREGQRVVIEGIPMVDQGQKGYCSVATAARVFGYYGVKNIDQHELASAAGTSAGGGTTVTEMIAAIKKIGNRFQVKVNVLPGSLDSVQDYLRFIKAYNRGAKRAGEQQFPDDSLDMPAFWNMVNADVLKSFRASKPADIERWMKPIRTYIDNGVPVLWSLELGIVPEPMGISQTRGGHMRLIIGYDDEKQEILFSDSWGKEHACKAMPMADAAAVTVTRMVIMPSK